MQFHLQWQRVAIADDFVDLFVPVPAEVKHAYEKGLISTPYWSQVWPASKALAGFLLQYPHFTAGKKVLEIGGGLGLPSLVAARNAQSVLCTDLAPEAIAIVNQSTQKLGLANVATQVLDWQYLPADLSADVLLLSDINYEPSVFQTLLAMIEFFLAKETVILLSTPQRLLAKDFVSPLLQHCTHREAASIMHEGKPVGTIMLVLQKS